MTEHEQQMDEIKARVAARMKQIDDDHAIKMAGIAAEYRSWTRKYWCFVAVCVVVVAGIIVWSDGVTQDCDRRCAPSVGMVRHDGCWCTHDTRPAGSK